MRLSRSRILLSTLFLFPLLSLIFFFYHFFVVELFFNISSKNIFENSSSYYNKVLFKEEFSSNPLSTNKISNFGSNEFKCSGYCFCDDLRKSSSSISLRRIVFHVVTAVTSYVAYTKAKEFFEEECRTKFSEECSDSKVVSEVEHCEVTSGFTEDGEWVDIRRYFCEGACQKKEFRLDITRRMATQFKCESIHQSATFEVDCSDIRIDYDSCNHRARMVFQREYLTIFCKKHSKKEYFYRSPRGQERYLTVNLCCSKKKSQGNNPSIVCLQSYPGFKNDKVKPLDGKIRYK